MSLKRRSIEERFRDKVNVKGPEECWPWTGSCSSSGGYGVMSKPGESSGRGNLRAHRVAWALSNGVDPLTIDPNFIVRHKVCDNPPCCNPAHLEGGTDKENMIDMVEKKRAWWQNPEVSAERSRKLSETHRRKKEDSRQIVEAGL